MNYKSESFLRKTGHEDIRLTIKCERKKLKIAIIATTLSGGGRARALAYKNFLQSKKHTVEILRLDETWQPKIWFLYQRAYSHFIGKDSRLMNKIADKLEGIIKAGNYDVVIGVESPLSYVLTRDLGCLKLFSWEAMGADELYFEQCASNTVDLERIRCLRQLENRYLRGFRLRNLPLGND